MSRKGVLMVAAWVVAAVTTAGIGTAALDRLGAGLLGDQHRPLSQAEVARELAGAPDPSRSSETVGRAPAVESGTESPIAAAPDGSATRTDGSSVAGGRPRADPDAAAGPAGPMAGAPARPGGNPTAGGAPPRAGGPAGGPAVPAPGSGTASPSSAPAARPAASEVFTSPGGTVVAACQSGLATLRSWSPAPGYAVHQAKAGPDDEASVEFRRDNAKVFVVVSCHNGEAKATVQHDD